MTASVLLLSGFTLLAGGLQFGGPNMPFWVVLLAIVPSALCMLFAMHKAKRWQDGTLSPRALTVALLVLLAVTLKETPGSYVTSSAFNDVAFTVTVAVLFYATFRLWSNGRLEKLETIGFWIALGAFVLLRAGMIGASPEPYIDVFSMIQQSCRNVAEGLNPYAAPIRDIYNGSMSWCYVMDAYSYPPGNLVFHLLGYFFAGDARAATVAADTLTALFLWNAGKRLHGRGTGELLALLFLAQPRALFVFEQAWTEPLLSVSLSAFLWLWVRGYRKTALAGYGFLISLKQYLVFTAFHIFILERRWKRLLLVVIGAGITSAPFLLWNPSALLSEGFLMQLQTCFRPQTPSLAGVLHALTGFALPKAWTAVLGVATAAFFPWWLRSLPPIKRYVLSSLGSLFCLFLLGSQGILNYYFFVGTVMLWGMLFVATDEK